SFRGITLERLKREGAVPLDLGDEAPFASGGFPTPSGKVELYSQRLADEGIDPLPGRFRPPSENGDGDAAESLELLTGASHHFVSSSLASQAGLLHNAGSPVVEIHPTD